MKIVRGVDDIGFMSLSVWERARLVRKLAGVLREFGLMKGAIYLADRVLTLCHGRVYFYSIVAQPVATASVLARRPGRTIAVRLVTSDELLAAPLPMDRKVIAYRMKQGAVCFGAFKGTTLVGYLWLCLSRYREDEVRCIFEFPVHCSWDFDVYVRPEDRMSIVFVRLWDAANEFLRHRHIKWSISRISALNNASLSAHRRLGAIPTGWMLFVCLGPMQLAISSIAPHLHFSMPASKVPVFSLESPMRPDR